MGKSVTNAVQFRDPFQYDLGPDRELFVLACDDGSVYVFQKFTDDKIWSLKTRGSRDEPTDDWEHNRMMLPSDVESTLDDVAGENGWTK